MKITKSQLKQLIKEELESVLGEEELKEYFEIEGKKIHINPVYHSNSNDMRYIKNKVFKWLANNKPESYDIKKHSALHIAMDLNELLFDGKEVLSGPMM
jgi:hypothetical protein